MLKSAEKTGTNEYTLSFEVDAAAFEAAVNKAYHKQKNQINVPGFRKGKAPRAMMEKMYGANLFYDEALEILFPDEYEAAIDAEKIEAVDQPFGFDIAEIGKEGLKFSCKVTSKPVITLEGYKGIGAVKASAEVSDEDVDAEINKKVEANAREISVEGRAAAEKDIAVIDFEGFVDGVAFEGGKGEDYDLELGSGTFIPGFEDQIVGKNIGDEFDVNVTFPEEYAEELAGKAAVFKCALKGLKTKELPELDDEFVKDVSEFDTVDELKADIRKNLEEKKAEASKNGFENEVLDKLSDLVTDEIPQCMIDKTADNMISEFKYRVESSNIPYEMYLQYLGMTPESLRDSYLPRAEKEVKLELALEKIAETEGFEVSDDELEEEVKKMAERYGVDADTVKKAIPADGIKRDILSRKASDFVVANAVEEEAEAPKKAKKAAAKKPAAKKAKKEDAAEKAEAPVEG